MLLPLRLFLGVTFTYAGLLKLSDHAYFDPNAPTGVAHQMQLVQAHSPISAIVGITASHPVLFGLMIALGELAVGLGVLLGLWTRLAAFGGMMLALSFFLTVSWTTRPYFFGSDIVFLFAFTPLVIAGDGGVLSWGSALRRSVRREAGLAAEPTGKESADVLATVDRRTMLRTGAVAAGMGAIAVLGGLFARVFTSSTPAPAVRGLAASTTPSPSPSSPPATTRSPRPSSTESTTPSAEPSHSSSQVPQGAVVLGPASSVPVGSAATFTDPKTGQPGIIVQPKAGTFLAYNSTCTHQGCPVGYNGSQFACPCHGATYAVATGDVTGGPAPLPLTRIKVIEVGGKIYSV